MLSQPQKVADFAVEALKQSLDLAAKGDGAKVPGGTQALQKSLQCDDCGGHPGVVRARKSLKTIGSSGRTRTYNPSVNSRMLCH